MSQDSSLVGAFDLNSQSGVMSVLASIRASNISPTEKNELRDLVFSYSNGGGDVTVRNQLEQKLNANKIVPVGIQRAGRPAPVLSFGTYRPTPDFKNTLQTTRIEPPRPTPVFYKNVVAENTVDTSGVSSVSIQTPHQIPTQPVTTEPAIHTPYFETSVAETSQQAVVPPVMNSQVSTPNASVPMPSPVVMKPVSVQTAGGDVESIYLERIRQIKTAVNSKIGNPVNLVDINNDVGREYMNALLEAMKKLGSGALSEMGPAMSRLESAFSAVEIAISKHEETSSTSSKPTSPVPVQTQISTPTTQVIPPPPPPSPPSITQVAPPTPPVTTVATSLINNTQNTQTPPALHTGVSISRSQPTDIKLEDRSMSWSNVQSTNKSIQTETPTISNSPSLADSVNILTIKNNLIDPSLKVADFVDDSLSTPEINEGLNQLLSDWSLFKKSGFFGTGPKGVEHPLFKKIADLQIPLLLAGRFEGASQEIRQSVTDYMNGWRYEQGIIYLPGETFEKYLRRVIKHILDLQKKK